MTKQEELSKVEETPKQGREAESQKWSWVADFAIVKVTRIGGE